MAVFFLYLIKKDLSSVAYITVVHVYTGQVAFKKVPKHTAMFN